MQGGGGEEGGAQTLGGVLLDLVDDLVRHAQVLDVVAPARAAPRQPPPRRARRSRDSDAGRRAAGRPASSAVGIREKWLGRPERTGGARALRSPGRWSALEARCHRRCARPRALSWAARRSAVRSGRRASAPDVALGDLPELVAVLLSSN